MRTTGVSAAGSRHRTVRRCFALIALALACTTAAATASAWNPPFCGGGVSCFAFDARRFLPSSRSRRLRPGSTILTPGGGVATGAREREEENDDASAVSSKASNFALHFSTSSEIVPSLRTRKHLPRYASMSIGRGRTASHSRMQLFARKPNDFEEEEEGDDDDDDDDEGDDFDLSSALSSNITPEVEAEAETEKPAPVPVHAYSSKAQDLRLFVTQRCIQSFMFLLASTRDLHTVHWIDEFMQPIIINNYWEDDDDTANPGVGVFHEGDKKLGSKLLNFHGYDAINATLFPTWDSFFVELLRRPDDTLLVTTPQNFGRRAYTDFDIEIEPGRLCARILSVREQITKEMTEDLDAIKNMGAQIWHSYWVNSKNRKNVKGKGDSFHQGGDAKGDNESSPAGFDRPSQIFLEFDPMFDGDLAPSPLRKGNFDLLYKLITQEAICRILESEGGVLVGQDEVENRASTLFLDRFYRERLLTHFVGSQWYCKGDEFIEELILSSPIMMNRNGGDASAPLLVVEPVRIVEQILLLRDIIAVEWKEVMEGIPSEHTEIRRLQLSRMMGDQTETAEGEFQ